MQIAPSIVAGRDSAVNMFTRYSNYIKGKPDSLYATSAFSLLDIPHITTYTVPDDAYWHDALHLGNPGHALLFGALRPLMSEIRYKWSKRPATPTTPANAGTAASQTYSVTLPAGYTYLDAECTIDGGLTYQACTGGSGSTATYVIGNLHREAGYVGIRIKTRRGGYGSQFNSPSATCWSTGAFNTSFTQVQVAWNDSSVVSYNAAPGHRYDYNNEFRYFYPNDSGSKITVIFTKGFRYKQSQAFGVPNSVMQFRVDGVIVKSTVTQAIISPSYPALQILCDYMSGDNATHTLEIQSVQNRASGDFFLGFGGIELYQ